MDADHGLHTAPVIPPLPFEALLSESQRLQALSLQLIRESRELRTVCSLIQHRYGHHHRSQQAHHRLTRCQRPRGSRLANGRIMADLGRACKPAAKMVRFVKSSCRILQLSGSMDAYPRILLCTSLKEEWDTTTQRE